MSDNNEERMQPGDGAAASAEQDHGAELEADLRKLQEERDHLFEQVARVQADFRNAQKRIEAEKLHDVQYANAKLIKGLLPAIDNFERALEMDHDHELAKREIRLLSEKPGEKKGLRGILTRDIFGSKKK